MSDPHNQYIDVATHSDPEVLIIYDVMNLKSAEPVVRSQHVILNDSMTIK